MDMTRQIELAESDQTTWMEVLIFNNGEYNETFHRGIGTNLQDVLALVLLRFLGSTTCSFGEDAPTNKELLSGIMLTDTEDTGFKRLQKVMVSTKVLSLIIDRNRVDPVIGMVRPISPPKFEFLLLEL